MSIRLIREKCDRLIWRLRAVAGEVLPCLFRGFNDVPLGLVLDDDIFAGWADEVLGPARVVIFALCGGLTEWADGVDSVAHVASGGICDA